MVSLNTATPLKDFTQDAMKNPRLKVQVLGPLTVSLLLLLSAFVYHTYLSKMSGFSSEVETNLDEVQKLLETQVASETEVLGTILQMLTDNQNLQRAWMSANRESLLRYSRPLLQELSANYRITHFYFHNPDQTNFLRVYDPERFGDPIDRYTLSQAVKTGHPSSGIELGKLGTMTLRMVAPWKIDGVIVGYIEVGEEVDHIIRKLHDVLGVEMYTSIYKEFLDQQSWEDGMQLLHRPNNWEMLPASVIINQSLKNIPVEFKNFLIKGRHDYMEMAQDLQLTIDSKTYRLGVIPLYDASSREIGDIIVLIDVTAKLAAFTKTILLSASFSTVIGLILFILFSTFLGKLERTISSYQNNLEEMVQERTKELSAALHEIKTLRGIIPVCSYCKHIRDDKGLWNQIESYVSKHSYAEFSHGICPECAQKHHPEIYGDEPGG